MLMFIRIVKAKDINDRLDVLAREVFNEICDTKAEQVHIDSLTVSDIEAMLKGDDNE